MKKKSNGTLIWIVILAILASYCSDEPMALLGIIIALISLPVIACYRIVRKRRAESEDHTHDRVNHKQDLVIDRNTGKAVNRQQSPKTAHSSKEHWKQQLDILLSNGTIDKAEYYAMMKQHSSEKK